MAKQPTFPITIMAGATAIRIYRSPVKPSKPKPLDLAAPDTTAAKEPKSKTYDSYVLSYYSGGKRIRTRFNELQQARDKTDAIKASLLNEDSAALQLTGEDALIHARAKMLASHLGLTLDQLAQEAVDLRKILGKPVSSFQKVTRSISPERLSANGVGGFGCGTPASWKPRVGLASATLREHFVGFEALSSLACALYALHG